MCNAHHLIFKFQVFALILYKIKYHFGFSFIFYTEEILLRVKCQYGYQNDARHFSRLMVLEAAHRNRNTYTLTCLSTVKYDYSYIGE